MFHTLNRTRNVVRNFELARNFTSSGGITNTYSPCKRLNFNNCCVQRPYSSVPETFKEIFNHIPNMADNTFGKIIGGGIVFVGGVLLAPGIRFYHSIYTGYTKSVEDDMSKLNDLIKQLDKLGQDIKKSYQESYTVIRPEDRVTASKIKEISTQCKFIAQELNNSIARLEKYRFKNLKKDIELAKYKKQEVESYYHIAESVFQCEIKNYRDASKSIIKALKKYVEAVYSYDNKSPEEKFKNIAVFLNYKLVNKKELTIEEEYQFLKEISSEVSQLSKPHRENIDLTLWYSDILTYISYVLFDSYSWEQKISDLGLIPTFLSIAATKVSPNNSIAYNNAGYQYGHLGYPDEAQHYIDQSIEIDSLCTISHYNKGLLLFLAGKLLEAKQVLTIAAKTIDPHYNYEKEKGLNVLTKDIVQVNKSKLYFVSKGLYDQSYLNSKAIRPSNHNEFNPIFTSEDLQQHTYLNAEEIKQINNSNIFLISDPEKPRPNIESENLNQANLSFLKLITTSLEDIESCEKDKPLKNSNNYFNRKDQKAVSTEKLEEAFVEYENYFKNQAAKHTEKYILNIA